MLFKRNGFILGGLNPEHAHGGLNPEPLNVLMFGYIVSSNDVNSR